MLVQGIVRALMILACVSPSLLCFTLATYLIAHNVHQGWGWLIVSRRTGSGDRKRPRRCAALPGA